MIGKLNRCPEADAGTEGELFLTKWHFYLLTNKLTAILYVSGLCAGGHVVQMGGE